MITRLRTGSLRPKQIFDLLHHTASSAEPNSFTQDNQQPAWRQAMLEELQALHQQNLWILVPPPPQANILGSRWTYKLKLHADGSVAQYKARLVAQGYKQEPGLNYFDTFSPVTKLPTVRILLTIATFFINGKFFSWTSPTPSSTALSQSKSTCGSPLDIPIYYINTMYVFSVRQSMLDLKQAPRQWYNTFSGFLLQLGFTFSTSDPSLLLYHTATAHIYLLLYVDDILLTGDNPSLITKILTQLQCRFQLKNLGPVNHFLGIHITHTSNGLLLSQAAYAQDILNRAGMLDCNPNSNPLSAKPTPHPFTSLELPKAKLYRSLVGALQYLTITRADIAFAVNQLSQHLHHPSTNHFTLLKKLLRYIKGTLSIVLPIHPHNLNLTTYADTNWANDSLDRRSMTGFCSFLGNTLISWQVKKQPTVARSSTEAEYRALATAASDVI